MTELENVLKNAPVTKTSSQALENLEIKKKQHQQFMEELARYLSTWKYVMRSISKEIRKLEKSLEKALEELDRVTVKPYVTGSVRR